MGNDGPLERTVILHDSLQFSNIKCPSRQNSLERKAVPFPQHVPPCCCYRSTCALEFAQPCWMLSTSWGFSSNTSLMSQSCGPTVVQGFLHRCAQLTFRRTPAQSLRCLLQQFQNAFVFARNAGQLTNALLQHYAGFAAPVANVICHHAEPPSAPRSVPARTKRV